MSEISLIRYLFYPIGHDLSLISYSIIILMLHLFVMSVSPGGYGKPFDPS